MGTIFRWAILGTWGLSETIIVLILETVWDNLNDIICYFGKHQDLHPIYFSTYGFSFFETWTKRPPDYIFLHPFQRCFKTKSAWKIHEFSGDLIVMQFFGSHSSHQISHGCASTLITILFPYRMLGKGDWGEEKRTI